MAFRRLSHAIGQVLPALTDPSAREAARMTALSRMLPLENALSSLRVRVRRLNAILEQLLECSDDIEGLCAVSSGRGTCTPPEFALCEIAIEAYSSRLEFLGDEIDSLTESISTARNSLELALDSERNRMARIELLASLLSVPLASIGAVAGIFGMNLKSGIEEASKWFLGVTVTTVLLSFSAFALFYRRYLSTTVNQARQVEDVQMMKRALRLMDTVHHIARRQGAFLGADAAPSGAESARPLPVRNLRQLLADNGVHVHERELHFLQAMFDDRGTDGRRMRLA